MAKPIISIGQMYEHVATGGKYRIVGDIMTQRFEPEDGQEVLIYFKESGPLRMMIGDSKRPDSWDLVVVARAQAPKSGYQGGWHFWTVYQSAADYSLWVRLTSEFEDGRFKLIE